ncbi:hypothetical protein Poly30_30490 [Planctomycetes bacterium Poly30]|uniref:Thioredoxin domain-containing protein n=1 Tax=Saltatorellus ferox TaxID=2528018 RepID=A0A518ETV6_9BACT|nr:hypothetical protein Poly30_30490 [Planctomycetes bacterium Poly30]
MAKLEHERSPRWLALFGLGIATATLTLSPAKATPALAWQPDGEGAVDAPVPALAQAASELTRWAWGSASDVGELGDRVDALLTTAAAEPDLAVWEEARPAFALAEASLRLAGRERSGLAMAMRELGWSAPAEPLRVNAVRAELRMLEAVVNGTPPMMDAVADGSSPRCLAQARIQEIFAGAEHVALDAQNPLSRLRERTAARLAALGVGQPFPRFLARDAAGNEVRPSRLTGRVTVLRFWEEGSPASMLAHEDDSRLVRRFWDAPFALLGATHSQDRTGYLSLIESRAFAGSQLFDGPISTVLFDELAKAGDALTHGAGLSSPVGIFEAWSRPAAGSLFVIDESGVIRGRDLPFEELEGLVSSLIAERRARLRIQGEGRLISGSTR